jgi:adenylylsulfate kinase-like enzyme
VRALFPAGRFIEVLVTASAETRRRRDPKGLYARAAAGQVAQFSGLSAPYEEPEAPELTIDTDACTVAQAADLICAQLK